MILDQIRIRSEHTIGLLKGRFQAVRELQIQITSTRHHKWAVIFVRCCIILHNLILRLEGGSFDPAFREDLYEAGRGYPAPRIPNVADDEDLSGSDDEFRETRRRNATEGQTFRRHIMGRLFNSATSGAVRRPG